MVFCCFGTDGQGDTESRGITLMAKRAGAWALGHKDNLLAVAAKNMKYTEVRSMPRQRALLCCGLNCCCLKWPFECLKSLSACIVSADITRFFDVAEEEVKLQMEGNNLVKAQQKGIAEHALFIASRGRLFGENNFLILSKPHEPYGRILSDVTVLRVYRGGFGYSVRRFTFDARTVTNVEVYDEWNALELIFELLVLALAVIALVILQFYFHPEGEDPPPTRDEERRKTFFFWLLLVSIIFIGLVVAVNMINTFLYRGVKVVIDTNQKATAFVTSGRAFNTHGIDVETHGMNSAHIYVLTLDPNTAHEAAAYLNQWKQISDLKAFTNTGTDMSGFDKYTARLNAGDAGPGRPSNGKQGRGSSKGDENTLPGATRYARVAMDASNAANRYYPTQTPSGPTSGPPQSSAYV